MGCSYVGSLGGKADSKEIAILDCHVENDISWKNMDGL